MADDDSNDVGTVTTSIAERIEQRLRDAQARKTFKDIGRKGGTAKERRALKSLSMQNLTELEDEDEAAAEKAVNKHAIWPPIDLQAEKDKGTQSGAALVKQRMQQALAVRPYASRVARAIYLQAVEDFKVLWADARTVDEVIRCTTTYFYYYNGENKGSLEALQLRFPEMATLPFDRWANTVARWQQAALVFGKQFMNLVARHGDGFRNMIEAADMVSPFTAEQEAKRLAQIQYQANDHISFISRIINEIESARTDREASAVINKYYGTGAYNRHGSGSLDDKKKYWIANAERNMKPSIEKLEKGLEALPAKYRQREEDWTWAFETKTKGANAGSDSVKINTYPYLSKLVRKGGILLTEKDNSVLRDKWGLKAVQYGNSLSDRESAILTFHTNEALSDLQEVIGTDLKKLNQMGGLGIDFATRGHSGSAATYHCTYSVINLTKKWGDGSLAHEWGHYLDNLIANQGLGTKERVNVNGMPGLFASATGAATTATAHTMKGIMHYIRHGAGNTEAMMLVAKNEGTTMRYMTSAQLVSDLSKSAMHLSQTYRIDPLTIIKVLQTAMYKQGIAEAEVMMPIGSSFQYRESLKPKSDYWREPWELFARAFEGYVMHRMDQMGMKSDFLQASRKWYVEKAGFYPYPNATDMGHLAPMFDQLFMCIRKEYDVAEYVAPADVVRVDTAFDNTSISPTPSQESPAQQGEEAAEQLGGTTPDKDKEKRLRLIKVKAAALKLKFIFAKAA